MASRLKAVLCGCWAAPAVADGPEPAAQDAVTASKTAPPPQDGLNPKPSLATDQQPHGQAELEPVALADLIAAAPAAVPPHGEEPAQDAVAGADMGGQQAVAAAIAEPEQQAAQPPQQEQSVPAPAPAAPASSAGSPRAGSPRSGRATPRSGRVTPGSGGKASPRTPRSYPLPPPPPPELAHAMQELEHGGAAAISGLDSIRALALSPANACLAPQLPELVPLLVRAMRAPRLDLARAAIATLRELLGACGAALAPHVADDSAPTTSALLCLLQKATGGDMASRRLAPDADACLASMVGALPPREVLAMLASALRAAALRQGQGPVQAKAACVLVAAAYRLAASTPDAFDAEAAASLLRLCEELLGAGAACRPAAHKLAALLRCVWGAREMPGGMDGEDGWATLLRLTVEPAAAADIQGAVQAYCGDGRDLAEGLSAWASGHALEQVVARLVAGAD